MAIVRLKPGHVQPVWAGHPWVYAQAIDRVEGKPTKGDEVSVVDPRGNLLGRGFFSPGSAIPVRILVRDAETQLGAAFFKSRIERRRRGGGDLGLPSGLERSAPHRATRPDIASFTRKGTSCPG